MKRLVILTHFVVLLIGATASVSAQTASDPDLDKARELLKTRSIESYQQAIGLLEKIVGRQPENRAAHVDGIKMIESLQRHLGRSEVERILRSQV